MTEITLPPLPDDLIAHRMTETEVRSLLKRYGERCADAAIEADRQARKHQTFWYDGEPPFPQNQEWFIAETTFGDRIVLTALPKAYSYDYKTADDTHIKADRIKRWAQFPDCEYLPPDRQARGGPVAWKELALDAIKRMRAAHVGCQDILMKAESLLEAERDPESAEPVAWINEDELPASYPYDEMFGFSEVRDGVRMFPVFWPGFVITPGYLDGHRDGLEWAAQIAEANHPLTGDWLYDDPHELAKALRKGPEMTPVTPQPPQIPPERPYPDTYFATWHEAKGWNDCRKAMLEAAPANGEKS